MNLTGRYAMTIRIVCENETGYDPTTGTFTYCDHLFSCDDSLLAKVTRCPKCQNAIRVGTSHRHVWADSGLPVADPNAVKQHARKLAAARQAGSGSSSTSTPERNGRNGRNGGEAKGNGPKNGSNGSNGQTAKPAASGSKPASTKNSHSQTSPTNNNSTSSNKRTSGSGSRNSESGTQSADSKKHVRAIPIVCYNCGTLLPELQPKCPSCMADLSKPAGLASDNLRVRTPVGFHRWLIVTAFAGITRTQLAWGFQVSMIATAVVVTGLMLMLTPPEAHMWIGIGLGVLGLIYAYIVYACYRACTNLGYPLRWWQRRFWLMILWFARRGNWRDDPADDDSRMILDLRDQNINDLTLVQVENLSHCEVLDISGCPVSDRGVKALHFLKGLRCLVLVGTSVSAAEVGRLQKSLPNCWIWR